MPKADPETRARILAAEQGPTVHPQPFPGATFPAMPSVTSKANDRRMAEQRIGLEAEGKDISRAQLDNTKTNTKFDNVSKLRTEYQNLPEVKSYRTSLPLLMHALNTEHTPAGDQGLIYDYAKIMDPLTGVREGESRSAAEVAAAVDQLATKLRKNVLGEGGNLPDDIREGYRKAMADKVERLGQSAKYFRTQYQTLAQTNGFEPAQVVGAKDDFTPFAEDYTKARVKLGWDKAPDTGLSGRIAEGSTKNSVPPKMQEEYNQYLDSHKTLNPQDYQTFTDGLYKKYGFGGAGGTPENAQKFTDAFNKGLPVSREIPGPDQQLNWYQSALSHAAADKGLLGDAMNFGLTTANAGAMGLPEVLGEKEGQFLARQAHEAHPKTTIAGEMVGGISPTMTAEGAIGRLGVGKIAADVGANAGYNVARTEADTRGDATAGNIALAAGIGGGGSLLGRGLIKGAKGFVSDTTGQALDAMRGGETFQTPSARGDLPVNDATPKNFQGMDDAALQAQKAAADRGVNLHAQVQAQTSALGQKAQEVAAGNRRAQEQFVRENFRSTTMGPAEVEALKAEAARRFPLDPKQVLQLPEFQRELSNTQGAVQGIENPDVLAQRSAALEQHLGLDRTPGTATIPPVAMSTLQRAGLGRAEEAMQGLPFVHGAREATMGSWHKQLAQRIAAKAGVVLPEGLEPGHATNQATHQALSDSYTALSPQIKGTITPEFSQTVRGIQDQALRNPTDERVRGMQEVQAALNDFNLGGTFEGDKNRDLSSRLLDISSNLPEDASPAQRDVARAAGNIRDQMIPLVAANNPAAAKKLAGLNEGWAMSKRMERASIGANGLQNGAIPTPQSYLQAVKTLHTGPEADIAMNKGLDQPYAHQSLDVLGGNAAPKSSLRETGIGLGLSAGLGAGVGTVGGAAAGMGGAAILPAATASLYAPITKQILSGIADGKLSKPITPDLLSNPITAATIDNPEVRAKLVAQALRAYLSQEQN